MPGQPDFIQLDPYHQGCNHCGTEFYVVGKFRFCPSCCSLGYQYDFMEYIEEEGNDSQ